MTMWSDWKAEMLEKLLPILMLGGDRKKAAQESPMKDILPGSSIPSLCRGYNGRIHRNQPVSLIFFSRGRLHPKSAIHQWNQSSGGNRFPAPDTLRTGLDSSFPVRVKVPTAFKRLPLWGCLVKKHNTAKQEAAPQGSSPPGQAPMRRLSPSGAAPGRQPRTARVNPSRLDENLTFP